MAQQLNAARAGRSARQLIQTGGVEEINEPNAVESAKARQLDNIYTALTRFALGDERRVGPKSGASLDLGNRSVQPGLAQGAQEASVLAGMSGLLHGWGAG